MTIIGPNVPKLVQVDREELEEMVTIAIAHWESQVAMIRYANALEKSLDAETIAAARNQAELREVDRRALDRLLQNLDAA